MFPRMFYDSLRFRNKPYRVPSFHPLSLRTPLTMSHMGHRLANLQVHVLKWRENRMPAPEKTTIWVVVSNVFYFHPYLGKWSNLTNIFQMGWNHQLAILPSHKISARYFQLYEGLLHVPPNFGQQVHLHDSYFDCLERPALRTSLRSRRIIGVP